MIEVSRTTPSVTVGFDCTCGNRVITDSLSVPSPFFEAETTAGSVETDWFDVECSKCSAEYTISISNSFGTGLVSVEPDVEGLGVTEEIYDDVFESILETKDIDLVALSSLDNILLLLNLTDSVPNSNLENTYLRLLYSNAISVMETFLADTLKSLVTKDEESLKKFVQTYKYFRDIKISLSQIYVEYENIQKKVISELDKILYHNLAKVTMIYKTCLGIELHVQELYECVSKRHDIVHRNGHDKDGNEIIITVDEVRKLVENIKYVILVDVITDDWY